MSDHQAKQSHGVISCIRGIGERVWEAAKVSKHLFGKFILRDRAQRTCSACHICC